MAATLWKDFKTVKVEKENGITWCILNRPEKRNAMNPQLHYDMLDALTELEVDKETQVLVLTGAGPSWCAGQDLREYFRGTDNNPLERRKASWASRTSMRPEICLTWLSRRSCAVRTSPPASV